jgi:hypothetical protein
MLNIAEEKVREFDKRVKSGLVVLTDGGRKNAGYRGRCDDCVIRAVAIAEPMSYQQVVEGLRKYGVGMPEGSKFTGVPQGTQLQYLRELGWGSTYGSMRFEDLPKGRLVVDLVTLHTIAVIDGIPHDDSDHLLLHDLLDTNCVTRYFSKG